MALMNFTTASRSSFESWRKRSTVQRASLWAEPCHMMASMTLRARPSPGGRSCRFQNRLVAPRDADGVDLNGQFHNIDVFVG